MRVISALLLIALSHARASQFFVAPDGAPSGDGSIERPWDLATALAHPAVVLPGDTIWLRGGAYSGPFTSKLTGRDDAPVVVRQFPGERATLLGCVCPESVLTVSGAATWYWGFEVRSNSPDRSSDRVRGAGITVLGPGTKFIHLIVHDNNQGFSFWTPAQNAELYGNVIFNNGWEASDRGHGHGIYAQNETGYKRLLENIVFNQFSHGIHIYGSEEAYLNNFMLEGNIAFNNGILSKVSGLARNLLLGGAQVAQNGTVIGNYTYFPPQSVQGENNIGYRAGCRDFNIRDNLFIGPTALALINCEAAVMLGNTFLGSVAVAVRNRYPDNAFLSQRPRGADVFVRPSCFERDRANVVVYNWDGGGVASVDLSAAGFRSGDRIEIRNVQDYFGKTLTLEYDGKAAEFPMSGWTVAEPAGWPAAPSTFPDLGVFQIIRTNNASAVPAESGPCDVRVRAARKSRKR
jgi:hypothetical protein